MTKAAVVLLALMFFVSCGKSSSNNQTMNSQVEQFETNSEFDIKIKTINFSHSEKEKIHEAADLIQAVVLSDEFKEEVLNHEFEGKKAFANNEGLTNLEIYYKILKGSEKKNYHMDLTLVAYYEDAMTVGYTMTNSPKIWMNRKFFTRYDAAEVTTNIVHEWLHKLGFEHDVSPTPERSYSVPYSVGYIVRKLARALN